MITPFTHRNDSGFFPWMLPELGSGVFPGPTNAHYPATNPNVGVTLATPLGFQSTAAYYPVTAPLEQLVEWYWKVKQWNVAFSASWSLWYNPGGGVVTVENTISGTAILPAQNLPYLGTSYGATPSSTPTPAPQRAAPMVTYDDGTILSFPWTIVNSSTGTTMRSALVFATIFGGLPQLPVFKQGSSWLCNVQLWFPLGYDYFTSLQGGGIPAPTSIAPATIDGVNVPMWLNNYTFGQQNGHYNNDLAFSFAMTRTDW